MKTIIKNRIKNNQVLLSIRLLFSSWILTFRSRRGFAILIAVIRLFASIGIIVSFLISADLYILEMTAGCIIYLLFSFALLVITILDESVTEKLLFQYGTMGTDLVIIIFFLLIKKDINSEIYILLLLPLVISAHFLPRWMAILSTLLIIFSYGITFFFLRSTIQYPTYQYFFVWLIRSLFLSLGTWLYRIQRNIPPPSAAKIISPKDAREHLETYLGQLEKVVPFDTASLQLLYRDRLLIVACKGFPNKNNIYSIEFPIDNPKFPNYKVIRSKSFVIENTNDYPSFRDRIYQGDHIKTWMGIPLISPSSGELFGIISIDSAQSNAYTKNDALNATRVGMMVSAFIMEATLGPAALTMLTMRESIQSSIRLWSTDLTQRVIKCSDDFEAASQIVKIGKKIFKTEDCSLYLIRPKYQKDRSEPIFVLHLVASTSIPSSQFHTHESRVSNQPGCGLTGYATHRNTTLNLSAGEIENSPYHGSFRGNLEYLESKKSKQVMIIPIRNFMREAVGALKIENKIGWPSENRFTLYEQYLFETFTHTVGALIEGIRQRNYINRQQTNFHHLRAMISDAIIKPLDKLLKNPMNNNKRTSDEYKWFRQGIGYVAGEIDNLLLDLGESLTLEGDGVIPALLEFVSLLSSGFPHFRPACEKIKYIPSDARDNLPYLVRGAFFDIGREALLNSIRHSKIEQLDNGIISLFFQKKENEYILTIEDNGKGFIIDKKISNGIKGMRKEIQTIERIGKHACLDICSIPKQGTSVIIKWMP